MADGDLARVDSIVPLYRKTVILRGNLANPGRFAWHPGMRVDDLIPDKESLITRNYWWRRAQLGLPGPEFEPTQGFAGMRQSAETQSITIQAPTQNRLGAPSQYGSQQSQNLSAPQRAGSTSLASAQGTHLTPQAQRTEVQAIVPEIDWDYAVIERLDPETLKNIVIPFDLGKLVL